MAFQRRFIPGLDDLKREMLDASMPDLTRIVTLEKRNNSDMWGRVPGSIYKVNVPGYLFTVTDEGYGSGDHAVDIAFLAASKPEYLYRHSADGIMWYNNDRPTYVTLRCFFAGDISGRYKVQTYHPICPGTSTYVRCMDADSWETTQVCFAPCKKVPDVISRQHYVIRVGRGENYLSEHGIVADSGFLNTLGATIFAGDWVDNFDDNWSLKFNGCKFLQPSLQLIGTYGYAWRFHCLDPATTSHSKMYCRNTDLIIYYDEADPTYGSVWKLADVNANGIVSLYAYTSALHGNKTGADTLLDDEGSSVVWDAAKRWVPAGVTWTSTSTYTNNETVIFRECGYVSNLAY